ncbi:MAG: YhcH/YjgK/YiaL family protein [Bacteroidaceae bacterium]
MILGKLSDSERIEALHPLFKQLFDYVKSNNLLRKDLGRIELDGDKLFINNSDVTLLPREEQILEVHHAYIDVHIPLTAPEVIGWRPTSELSLPRDPFDEKNDFAVYEAPASTYVIVRPGEFFIAFPEDAHAPIIGEGKLRKAIAKVKQ